MSYLLLAVGALAVGPLALGWLRRGRGLASWLDGFVVVAIPGLVFFEFVPHAIEHREFIVLVALGVGVLLPPLIERVTHELNHRTDRWSLILGVTGLAIHAALDGAALAAVDSGQGGDSLALAVLIHRLPVGLGVWWLAARTVGSAAAVAALAALMAATIAGFAGGAALTTALGASTGIVLYQAVVGGSLVHVVAHGVMSHTPRHPSPRAEGSGAIVALALVLAIAARSNGHGSAGSDFLEQVVVVAAQGALALWVAYALSGLLSAFAPAGAARRVDAYREPHQSGAPALGITSVLLSLPLLGGAVTAARVVATVVVTFVVDRGSGTPEVSDSDDSDATGWRDTLDRTAPWFVVGLIVAALALPLSAALDAHQWPAWAAVLILAGLGLPIYLSAVAATPVVAVLLASGLSPGAGIAFLITASGCHSAFLRAVADERGGVAAARFAIVLGGSAVAAGLATNLLLPLEAGVSSVPLLTDATPSSVQIAALLGLGLLFASSVLRRGVRGFVGEVRSGSSAGHRHDHHGAGHVHPGPDGKLPHDPAHTRI